MLIYKDIIEKLTDEQKIRLLTGVADLSGKDFKILGIPGVSVGQMRDCLKDLYPRASEIVHAWDPELWHAVATEKAKDMRKRQVRFAITPGAKIKLSPYRPDVSEDPFLASMLSASYLRAAREAGVMAGAAGYYLTEQDGAFMDAEPNERVMREMVFLPYDRALRLSGASAVVTDLRAPSAAYETVCHDMQQWVARDVEFSVCTKATDENTVACIAQGIVCLQGSANALEAAMFRYKKLRHAVDCHEGSLDALMEEVRTCTAISDEAVCAALDRTLSFIFCCASGTGVAATENVTDPPSVARDTDDREELSRRALLESIVLLKNRQACLPLSRSRTVGLIGELIGGGADGASPVEEFKTALEQRGYTCTGITAGYDRQQGAQPRTEQALALCRRSDVVVLFLGFDEKTEKNISKTEKLTLPANQLYLADQLLKANKTVICVLSSGHAPDIAFTRPFDAVLLAPMRQRYSAQALADVFCGSYNPSGRLAYTLYAGSDTAFRKRAVYQRSYGMRCGPFIGYRYYDTAEMRIGYPFGHGCSYTEFKYFDLTVDANTVSLTVENLGEVEGVETVQVYIGMTASSVLRPKKELCAFSRVALRPGQRKRITLDAATPKVFDGQTFVLERGVYTVYVGSSVTDIRLTGQRTEDGVTLPDDGAQLCDYLQSVSNIVEENFTLEAKYTRMKTTVKNIAFGIGALLLAVSLALFNALTNESSVFLGVVAGILAVSSMLFFLLEVIERNRRQALERANIEQANEAQFENAEQVPFLGSAQLFTNEFDAVEEEEATEAPVTVVEALTDEGEAAFIDTQFSILQAVKEFKQFALERGFKMKESVVENLFSSLATSRLIFLNGLSSSEFNSILLLLSEYFGSEAYVDSCNDLGEGGGKSFFQVDAYDDHTKRNVLLALQTAGYGDEKIRFAALNDASIEALTEYLHPFLRYIHSPKQKNDIVILNEQGSNVGYTIPSNLWIIVRLSDYERMEDLPLMVARLSAIVTVSFSKCQRMQELTAMHSVNRYQLAYMSEKQSGAADISEELYKKVDRLEKYVSGYTDYRIGNKLWLAFEKQIGLLLSCEMDMNLGFDAVIAARLLPSMQVALSGKLSREDKTLADMLEFIFGEDSLTLSKAFLNRTVAERIVTEPEPRVESAAEPAVTEPSTASAEEPAMTESSVESAEEPASTAGESPIEDAQTEDAQTEDVSEESAHSGEDEATSDVTDEVADEFDEATNENE